MDLPNSILTFLYLDGSQDYIPNYATEPYLNINVTEYHFVACTVTSEARTMLSKVDRFPTVLNGISQIDESVAEILAETPGKLRLDNLSSNRQTALPHCKQDFYEQNLKSFSDELIKLINSLQDPCKENLLRRILYPSMASQRNFLQTMRQRT